MKTKHTANYRTAPRFRPRDGGNSGHKNKSLISLLIGLIVLIAVMAAVGIAAKIAAPPLPAEAATPPSGWLPNGVYALAVKADVDTNPSGNPRRIDVQNRGSAHLAGTIVQQYRDSDPIAAQRRTMLFKITYLGNNYYSIRSMVNSAMGLKGQTIAPNIVTADIGGADDTRSPQTANGRSLGARRRGIQSETARRRHTFRRPTAIRVTRRA